MEEREVFMATTNTISGQSQNTDAPVYRGFSDDSESLNAGREYGKELMRWAGSQLKGTARLFNALFIRLSTRIPSRAFGGVSTAELDGRMRKIKWSRDYYSREALARGRKKPRLQRDIMRVNSIFRDLNKLSDSGHYMGEELRWKLQYKYWTNTQIHAQIGNTLNAVVPPGSSPSPVKNNIRSNNYVRDNGVATDISKGQTASVSQKQQQNEARRIKVVYGGGHLGTSISPRQLRPKKGLGL